MARRSHDDALGVVGAETVIGAGVSVKGDITSESDVLIDGMLEGIITTNGDVTIGINATIKANVTAGNVIVTGRLVGNIVASGEANIRETGQVEGDITSAGLAITSGGVFVGRSFMQPLTSLNNTHVKPNEVHEPRTRKL